MISEVYGILKHIFLQIMDDKVHNHPKWEQKVTDSGYWNWWYVNMKTGTMTNFKTGIVITNG